MLFSVMLWEAFFSVKKKASERKSCFDGDSLPINAQKTSVEESGPTTNQYVCRLYVDPTEVSARWEAKTPDKCFDFLRTFTVFST